MIGAWQSMRQFARKYPICQHALFGKVEIIPQAINLVTNIKEPGGTLLLVDQVGR